MVLTRQFEKTGRLIALAALFCGAIALLLWGAIFAQLRVARASAIKAAEARNANLVVSLEQYAIRTIHNADALLQEIRHEYSRQDGGINLDSLLSDGLIDVPYVQGIGILNTQGRLVAGDRSMRPNIGVDLSDREHFRNLEGSTRDTLFIGTPIHSRTINKVVIPLGRRIVDAKGHFAGTVALQIEPRTFTYFYAHARMRPNDLMSLIALNGITYARRTGKQESQGEDISRSPLFRHVAENPVGNYYARDAIRGIPTFFSYRKLEQYPMIATVGVSEDDVLADYRQMARREYVFGVLISVLLLAFFIMVLLAIRQRKQRIASIRKAAQKHRRERRRLQRQLTQQIIAAQERERESIGRELHDNVNQVLTTVKLYLEMMQSDPVQTSKLLPRAITYLQQCISGIRNLSRELSAPTLGTRSIIDAISALVEMVAEGGGYAIHFDHPSYWKALPKEHKLALYRILQEQLNNIQKHAEATDVWITLEQDERQTTLRIADNGKGFDASARREGIGLNNIRSRARALGGSFLLDTAPGRGCVLSISLPLQKGDFKPEKPVPGAS
jgi:signal transduction histidine kinase